MATIREVSKRAGVSVATVSRAMRQPDKVTPKTRRKVERAIAETGYQPNMLARSFRTSRSELVLVLVPNIANPFFARVIRGIEQVATEKGYSVLLGDTRYSAEMEDRHAQLVSTRRADGLIQLNARMPKPVEAMVRARELPLVSACEVIDDYPGPAVMIDNVGAAGRMTSHLADLGHRNVGVVTGPKDNQHTVLRLEGYRRAAAARGLVTSFVAEGAYTMASGYEAVAKHEGRPLPTAILCFNDEMALGAIKRLVEGGHRVPEDVSVAGFDDIELGRYVTPGLTTVSQPADEMGRTAMRLFWGILSGEEAHDARVVLPTELIVRGSTGPALA
jgi:LacI family repressor for deo operon, udp, cdd, tsx, nupC, and nupG